MSCARSRADYLAARDARQRLILAACRLARKRGDGAALLVAGVNLPGPDKHRPGVEGMLARAVAALTARGFATIPVASGTDLLGPYRLLLAAAPAVTVKIAAVEVEARMPGGRLLDLDVLTSDGEPVDRRRLGLEPRCCYVCPRPASECMRLARHGLPELLAAVAAHLALARTS